MPRKTLITRRPKLPNGLNQKKLLEVDETYTLEPFHKRLESGDEWVEIWTRQGKEPGDEWVEIMAGSKKDGGAHYHLGINKNASRRFLKKRGVLKSITEFAVNKRTGELLDKQEATFSGGSEHSLIFRLDASKLTKRVWVSEFRVARTDNFGEIAPRR